jgi:polyketide cyclase/dehydrase/lipid transport protein
MVQEQPPGKQGQQAAGPEIVTVDPALPIAGHVELDMSVEQLWTIFQDVQNWPHWNPCFWRARVLGGELKAGSLLSWWFNPIRPQYLYKIPVLARIVEYDPLHMITWEVKILPGFHALHRYSFEAIGAHRCRFSSWEVAEGPVYRLLRRFWLAHFRYVRQSSLAGAQTLVQGADQ